MKQSYSSGLAFVLICGGGARVACSQAYTFATFEGFSGTKPVAFTNASPSASNPFGSITLVAPITFRFTDATGLSTIDQPATLTADSKYDQFIGGTTQRLYVVDTATGKDFFRSTCTGDIVGAPGST